MSLCILRVACVVVFGLASLIVVYEFFRAALS